MSTIFVWTILGLIINNLIWANLYLFGQFLRSAMSTIFSQEILNGKLLLVLI